MPYKINSKLFLFYFIVLIDTLLILFDVVRGLEWNNWINIHLGD